jgi:hypothetical protein
LERRKVAQGTLLRATIHLVSARDYWAFALGTKAARQRWWLRAQRGALSADQVRAAAERLRTRLRAGPIGRVELQELLGGTDMANGVGLWLDLVRVPPAGTWDRRRADVFGAATDWLGPPPDDLSPDDALERLVRRYLGGFGPAARPDIASWAGTTVGDLTPVLDRIALRRFQTKDGRALVDLPRQPLPDPDTPAPVRFLAVWDAALLVHARRKGILAEVHRPLVFNTKQPHSMNTFLVDGTVAGTWRFERGRVHCEPFGRLSRADRLEVEEEAERLAAFHS